MACNVYDSASTLRRTLVSDRTGKRGILAQHESMATMQPNQPFLADIKEIRRRARAHIDQGAVTEGYKADLKTVLRILNEALATEIVCVLRYKRHQFMARGLNAGAVADEFAEHAAEEQSHADQI